MKKIILLLLTVLLSVPALLVAQAPTAYFSAAVDSSCGPTLNESFLNSSLGSGPLTYKWDFPGATPDTSTLRNPINIQYNGYGCYNVKLVASNQYGSDSLTKNNYVCLDRPINAYFTGPTDLCHGSQATITAYGGTQYHWDNGATTSSINITAVVTKTYTVQIRSGACFKDTSFTVQVDTCLGISPITNQLEVSIYPNPASSFLHIIIEKSLAESADMSISDITGRILLNGKINLTQSQLTIAVSSLSPGIYFIKFQTEEGILVRKFVKD